MKNAPSHPARVPRIRRRTVPLAALAGLVLGACAEATEPTPEPQAADPATIVSMRLRFGPTNDPTVSSVMTISLTGAITGSPVVRTDPYGFGDTAIPVEASFLDVGGAVVRPLVGVELVVTPTDETALDYHRTDPFSGTLGVLRTGDTRIRVELIRTLDKSPIFGPFTLPLTVRL